MKQPQRGNSSWLHEVNSIDVNIPEAWVARQIFELPWAEFDDRLQCLRALRALHIVFRRGLALQELQSFDTKLRDLMPNIPWRLDVPNITSSSGQSLAMQPIAPLGYNATHAAVRSIWTFCREGIPGLNLARALRRESVVLDGANDTISFSHDLHMIPFRMEVCLFFFGLKSLSSA